MTGSEVIMAVGRKPYVEGLDVLGIVDKGRVEVDSSMRTKAPNVYAAGDVIGRYMLYHAAVKGVRYCCLEHNAWSSRVRGGFQFNTNDVIHGARGGHGRV